MQMEPEPTASTPPTAPAQEPEFLRVLDACIEQIWKYLFPDLKAGTGEALRSVPEA
jgi:hypothetical protein